MYHEAFRLLQAEDVSLADKLEALRKLTSISTRAPWPNTLLLEETLRQIAAATQRNPTEANHLAPYWQFVTSCVERRQIQAHHVAQILRCAARMPLPVSSSETAHLDCLLLTMSAWKFRLPQKEATEMLVTMLHHLPNTDPDLLTRQHKVIVRSLCHAQLCPRRAGVKASNPIEALQSFVQHLLPAFSKLKTKERGLGMIILRSLVHDCRTVGEKQLFAQFSQNIGLISCYADFFTSSLLLPVSALPADPQVFIKRGKKRLRRPAAVDARLDTQNVALTLTILTSCLKNVGQQNVQQVLQSIELVLSGDTERADLSDATSRADLFQALPSRVLMDIASAVGQFLSSTDTAVKTQCLALESLCATSIAASHIPEVQQHLLKATFASDRRESLVRGKERLVSHIFQARSNRTQLSELLKILARSLASLDEQTASLFCSAKVLRNLAAAIMSLPRTHSTPCLQILLSASERAHPVVFVIVAAIVEAVPYADFDASYALAVKFLHLGEEKTADDTYTALKLYLVGTLVITKYRQCRGISLSDIQDLTKWLNDDGDASVEHDNWKVWFVTKIDSLSCHGVKSRMAAERLRHILTHLHCLQENVNTSNVQGLFPISGSEGHGRNCGNPPNGTNFQQTEGYCLPQVILGAPPE